MTDNLRGAALMAAAMAAFTVNDAAMKLVTDELPLFQSIAMRGALTVLGLGLLVVWRAGGRFALPRGARGPVALRSAFEVIGTVTFIAALMHMPLPNMSAIFQALPLAMTLAAALVLGERVGWRRLSAIAAGGLGVLLIIRPGAAGFDVWSLVALAAVAATVVRDLATRRVPVAVPAVTVAFWAAAALTAVATVAATAEGLVLPGRRELGLCLFAACILMAGYLAVITATRTGEVGFVAPYRYTALVWALLLGWVVFGDWPDALTLTGAAIVVGSGLFTIWRETRLRRDPVAARVDIPRESA